jgi:hypothetical protein
METNVTNPTLGLRLIAIAKADQDMRNNAIHNKGEWDHSLDKKHTQALKEIIAEYGWPTIPMVGVEASNDAWLIAQHADHDVLFQKECLALLKKVSSGEVPLNNIAYLEDRILVAEHKPQLYGTQFQGTGPNMKPQPIHDKSHVDARRKEMGLGTLEEYTKLMFETYKNTD